ncbi:MAG: SAM-dependent methyltransferase [Acidimicrobiales bacterium]
MTPAVQDWNDPAAVAEWIAGLRRDNPRRQAQLERVVTLLGQVQARGLRLLDLGCGDGVVAEQVLIHLPGSTVVGLDQSPPMLAAAEARLAAYPGRARLVRRALDDPAPLEGEAPFDAAMAVQSVHHLDAAGKRALFAWVAAHLRPGGLFVLSDRVRLPSAALYPYHQALYSAQQAQSGEPLLPAGYGYGAHLHALALGGDRPDTVADQLTWLRAAGFGEADCFYREVERAIFGGLKQAAGPPDCPVPGDGSAALLDESQYVGRLL